MPQGNIDMQSWYAVNAPAGTPEDRIATLHRAIVQIVRTDDFRQRLEPLGFRPVWDETPAAYGTYLREQERFWQTVVEASGATLD
jgi:tripartite-type tricarboxylate transporter receptor subunit TctC